MLITAGDQIPADLRIIESKELRIDESALTGESIPVHKNTQVCHYNTILAERNNMAYYSTFVINGFAKGVVVHTGDHTEIGKINQLITQTKIPQTPLTQKINAFSSALLYIILSLALITFVVGVLRGESYIDIFLASVALAVAAIPEGLPAAITIILAIGVSRMAKEKAIVRKLPAVETLGSTSIICSDKTGTLTQNQMTVQHIVTHGLNTIVTGVGYQPTGEFLEKKKQINPHTKKNLLECLKIGALCNDAQLIHENNNWNIIGDPTEGALLTSAKKAGLELEQLQEQYPIIDHIPFESKNQYMVTLHKTKNKNIIYMKGSIEQILKRCSSQMSQKGTKVKLNKKNIIAQAEKLAKEGLRIIAFAKKEIPSSQKKVSQKQINSTFTFVGLQAMIDPPRRGVIESIHSCQTAGIQVKMITGDHQLTAIAIAKKIGLIESLSAHSLHGNQISKLSDEELLSQIDTTSVFARVSPEDKLRLVKAFQKKGNIVAMTGDGVNDSPSLRQANIGIAMGLSGTDIAKETSDLILTDDNFSTIESAVKEGRGVYDNLIKFITWTLPTNFGEGVIILAAIFIGVLLPILPVQLLWINMTTAILLGLMLAFEPKEKNIMEKKPRKTSEPILSFFLVRRILIVGFLLCIFAFYIFQHLINQGMNHEIARTVAVNIFVFGEMAYLLNCRSLTHSPFKIGFFSNPLLIIGIVCMTSIQIAFTYTPFMNHIFSSAPLTVFHWAYIIGASAFIFITIEIEKKITVSKKINVNKLFV